MTYQQQTAVADAALAAETAAHGLSFYFFLLAAAETTVASSVVTTAVAVAALAAETALVSLSSFLFFSAALEMAITVAVVAANLQISLKHRGANAPLFFKNTFPFILFYSMIKIRISNDWSILMIIKNIDYTNPTIGQANQTKPTINNGFDQLYESEISIYAVPESQAQKKTESYNAPVNLENIFQNAAKTYNISIDLLKGVAKAESNFNSNCTSGAGAMGIMQLMPDTAKSLGVSDPYNPNENIMGGAKYLSQLLSKYNGNISLTLAAYNAGPGNVDKYNGIPPFKETQAYVKRVLDYATGFGDGTITYTATNDTSQTANAATAGEIYTILAIPDLKG